MEKISDKDLLDLAVEARKNSYSPYSNMAVGAALLCKNGKVYRGCNIESSSYSPTNCAERTAFFKAISEGEREFEAIAVVGGPVGQEINGLFPPCGVCRQVMMEFCDADKFRIIMGKNIHEYELMNLRQLLPMGFGPNNMK